MGKVSRYFQAPEENEGSGTVDGPSNQKSRELATKPAVDVVTASNQIKKYKKDERKKWQKKKKETVEKFPGPLVLPKAILNKYSRGQGLSNAKNIKTDVRKARIMQKEKKILSGVEFAAKSEILLTEDSGAIEVDEGEHTLQLKQLDITKNVDISSATKGFHLSLDQFGPYTLRYTTNGRYLALGGRKGHIAAFDWVTKNLMCEIGVKQSVHDIVWLHNENMFAVAQKEWTFIYDNQGLEIHCLKSMDKVINLGFLPYHFLLVGGHQSGYLSWVDVSIGKIVTQFNARQGPIGIMTTNSANAVVHCGHSNGTVSLWAPTIRKPLASILCHGCPLSAVAVDSIGRLMATSGRDGSLRIWDLRNSFTPLSSVKVDVASSLDFSQRGLLAMGTSSQALIFSEVGHKQKPYIKHVANSQINSLQFCPFEDILGVGTYRGFDSIIVPGAGEPNFDALERNPFQTKNQRREMEVKALLEKIQPELISLDNNILGEVNTGAVNDAIDSKPKYVKKADIQLAHRKKRKTAKLPKIKDALRSELNLKTAKQEKQSNKKEGKSKAIQLPSDDPLKRFVKKD